MPDDVKFCPYCGHHVLYQTPTNIRCHGCGADFDVLETEDIKDLRETFDAHQDCLTEKETKDLMDLQEAVCDYLHGRIERKELEEIYNDTL